MNFFDTHCHFEGTESEIQAILHRAEAAGVTRIIAMGCDPTTNEGAKRAAKLAPEKVGLSLGFDYTQEGILSVEDSLARLHTFREDSSLPTLACIGEIGMDAHYRSDNLDRQAELFQAQLRIADEWGLPVSVHTREADAETLHALDDAPQRFRKGLRGVIHCYTGDMAFARQLLDRNFAVSFSGIVTFRNADPLRAVAKTIPDDRLLIETDAPFLAPVPLRGQKNEPAFVPHVARCLATVRGSTPETIADITAKNAELIFRVCRVSDSRLAVTET